MPAPSSRHPFDRPARNTPHLRILHAIFSSGVAGSERYCADLANRQAALGHEVHLAGRRDSPLAHLLDARVRFHGLGRLLLRWQVRRLVNRLDPDVCHGHLSAACKAFGALPPSRPRLATLHVGYKPHQHGRLDGLICVNHAQSRRLDGYQGNMRIIPNWVPEMTTAPAAGLRRELGLRDGTLLIGSVGRLHESKGADLLIQAFRTAAPENAALVLIGDGPQRAALEQLRGGDARIHFAGHRSDVKACLADLDLFVSPSREESFGLAILEAMHAGLPVISTAAEGPAEHLRDQPVTLVPPGELDPLVKALAEAAVQFSSGRLGRRTYDLSGFSPAQRVGEILDFYRESIRMRLAPAAPEWMPLPAAT